jgi:hypothetical protein
MTKAERWAAVKADPVKHEAVKKQRKAYYNANREKFSKWQKKSRLKIKENPEKKQREKEYKREWHKKKYADEVWRENKFKVQKQTLLKKREAETEVEKRARLDADNKKQREHHRINKERVNARQRAYRRKLFLDPKHRKLFNERSRQRIKRNAEHYAKKKREYANAPEARAKAKNMDCYIRGLMGMSGMDVPGELIKVKRNILHVKRLCAGATIRADIKAAEHSREAITP